MIHLFLRMLSHKFQDYNRTRKKPQMLRNRSTKMWGIELEKKRALKLDTESTWEKLLEGKSEQKLDKTNKRV